MDTARKRANSTGMTSVVHTVPNWPGPSLGYWVTQTKATARASVHQDQQAVCDTITTSMVADKALSNIEYDFSDH
ncbi:hypothetical protein E2C01_042376 [Portunus trituberculatus]|uniref:Uncharacterized protein n=1 Tax=Portunus trituberculatus TaxID=210409 RepID=A0A5B7FTI4_PORTR|nr:hypothetical protein [Portunus trituberculatus]